MCLFSGNFGLLAMVTPRQKLSCNYSYPLLVNAIQVSSIKVRRINSIILVGYLKCNKYIVLLGILFSSFKI